MVLVTYFHVAGCLGATKRWTVENFQKLSRILLAVGRFIKFLYYQKLLMQFLSFEWTICLTNILWYKFLVHHDVKLELFNCPQA